MIFILVWLPRVAKGLLRPTSNHTLKELIDRHHQRVSNTRTNETNGREIYDDQLEDLYYTRASMPTLSER